MNSQPDPIPALRSRDERFYDGVTGSTVKGGGWRQCRYCKGYADAGSGEIPPVKHVSPCPVGELEETRERQEPAKPVRMCVLEAPFNKRGVPLMGQFGSRSGNVVIFTIAEWKRLCETVPQLQTTQFEVGSYE